MLKNGHIGFDVCQKLIECETVDDLDEAIRIVNGFYRVYRDRLEILEDNEFHIDELIKEIKVMEK
jgi:ribosomal 30S subunit maturation factor RimM